MAAVYLPWGMRRGSTEQVTSLFRSAEAEGAVGGGLALGSTYFLWARPGALHPSGEIGQTLV